MTEHYEYRRVPVETLRPYERNPRTHSPEQIEALRRSIQEFGFTNPLLVDEENELIAGHGRLLAAQAEGMTEIPVIIIKGLSEPQRRALVIADNKLALNAGWDDELLREELLALKEGDFDLDLVGFSKGEMEVILEGWGDEIAKSIVGAAGETLEGIERTIKITCTQEEGEAVLECVRAALEEAGFGHLEVK